MPLQMWGKDSKSRCHGRMEEMDIKRKKCTMEKKLFGDVQHSAVLVAVSSFVGTTESKS